jgi:ethanolamine ammonia-lyase small subunit
MSIKKTEQTSLQRSDLKQFTNARVALRTSGVSLCTEELLAFKLAHARAVDAVWTNWNRLQISEELSLCGIKSILIESEASNRMSYVQNPQSGCHLNEQSKIIIQSLKNENAISIILADGLSPMAAQEQGSKLITCLIEELRALSINIHPVFICSNGRVAIGDSIGEINKSKIAIVIIGERPGLTTPQSLGMYITLNPSASSTNANRNCISNIHHEGLSIEQASNECKQLIEKMLKHNISGYQLHSK